MRQLPNLYPMNGGAHRAGLLLPPPATLPVASAKLSRYCRASCDPECHPLSAAAKPLAGTVSKWIGLSAPFAAASYRPIPARIGGQYRKLWPLLTWVARSDLVFIGYARVSTLDQDPGYQLRALEQRGCERIFTDRCPGRVRNRPQLTAAMDFLRAGDALVVWKFDRLARNLRNLIDLGTDLDKRGCQLVSLAEAIDTTTPGGKLVFAVFGAMAEFEADLNRERTGESYKAAGRRSVFHDPENVRIAQAMLADRKIPRKAIAKRFGVDRNVLYHWFPGGDPDAYDGKTHRRAG